MTAAVSRAKADQRLAARLRKHGVAMPLRIIREARRAGLPLSLALALVDKESGFRNVFGHDDSIYNGAGIVTPLKYRRYKKARGPRGEGGMQGVGPCQLTFWTFQDDADKLGGCWRPSRNMRVAFTHLRVLTRTMGTFAGIAAYNGSGANAQRYAHEVMARETKWKGVLK
jgi:hypothetical protein